MTGVWLGAAGGAAGALAAGPAAVWLLRAGDVSDASGAGLVDATVDARVDASVDVSVEALRLSGAAGVDGSAGVPLGAGSVAVWAVSPAGVAGAAGGVWGAAGVSGGAGWALALAVGLAVSAVAAAGGAGGVTAMLRVSIAATCAEAGAFVPVGPKSRGAVPNANTCANSTSAASASRMRQGGPVRSGVGSTGSAEGGRADEKRGVKVFMRLCRLYPPSSDHGNALQLVQNPAPGKRYKKKLHHPSLAGTPARRRFLGFLLHWGWFRLALVRKTRVVLSTGCCAVSRPEGRDFPRKKGKEAKNRLTPCGGVAQCKGMYRSTSHPRRLRPAFFLRQPTTTSQETFMSQPSIPSFPDFGKLVPGFDFLQNLAKQAASGSSQAIPQLPNLGNWIAPTLNVEDLDKRVQELKAVQFWLDQNAAALKATIQALEVQKMTLATLKGMNLNMAEMANAFTLKPTESAPASKPTAEKGRTFAGLEVPLSVFQTAKSEESASKDAESAASPVAANSMVDPMQWWGSLTQQFQTIATEAMKEVASKTALDATASMATGLVQDAVKTATDMTKDMAETATKTMTGGARAAMDTALSGGSWPASAKTSKSASKASVAKTPVAQKAPARKAASTTSGKMER